MIHIAYDPRQSATRNDSFSPSATKPKKVMEAWRKLGIPFKEVPVNPCTEQDLSMVHDRLMVRDILARRRENGFGNTYKEVAEALPWVSGSMVTAMESARISGGIAFSPTSGAHHAGYDFTGGFCTFNFLALAAVIAHGRNVGKVGILDCDAHYGNGTDDIIKHFRWKWITHHSMGAKNHRHSTYLRNLSFALDKFAGVDLMIYNAGADSHERDPLGGFLSTEELKKRDKMVLGFCKDNGIPVVVSLAGGYQDIKTVIKIHCNTLQVAHDLFA